MFDKLLSEIQEYNPRADLGLLYVIRWTLEKVPENRDHPYSYLVQGLLIGDLLVHLQTDIPTIAAGILLPAVNDGVLTTDRIRLDYGLQVNELIEGVRKLDAFVFHPEFGPRNEKNFLRMLLEVAEDYRWILIFGAWKIVRYKILAAGTAPNPPPGTHLEYLRGILIPLSEEWSIASYKREFENLQLYWREPGTYNRLAWRIADRTAGAEQFVKGFTQRLREMFRNAGIDAEVSGRTKSVASTWFKIEHRVGSLDEVFDLLAIRIIVEREEQCYDALSLIHGEWEFFPDKYKDYIKKPKRNGYRSIHSTIVGPDGRIIEIQVRTFEMHNRAERGFAVHWHYKKLISRGILLPSNMTPVREKEAKQPQVFVFTPRGEVIDLPQGATGLDFAFRIHTDIGYRAVGVKVNNQMAPLRRRLHSGEVVEIVTAARAHPSEDWLKFVKSKRARAKIERWLTVESERKSLEDGMRWLNKQLKKFAVSLNQLERDGSLQEILKGMGLQDSVGLAAAVSRSYKTGERFLAKLESKLKRTGESTPSEGEKRGEDKESKPPIPEKGVAYDLEIEGRLERAPRLSKCCDPKAPQPIFAFITRGRGFTIHAMQCPNAFRLLAQTERVRKASWRKKS